MSEFLGAVDYRSGDGRVIKPHYTIRGLHYLAQQAALGNSVSLGAVKMGCVWFNDQNWDKYTTGFWDSGNSDQIVVFEEVTTTYNTDLKSLHYHCYFENQYDATTNPGGDYPVYTIAVFLSNGLLFAVSPPNYTADMSSNGETQEALYYNVLQNVPITLEFSLPFGDFTANERAALGYPDPGVSPPEEPEPEEPEPEEPEPEEPEPEEPEPESSAGIKITEENYSLLNLMTESIKLSPFLELAQVIDDELKEIGKKFLVPALYYRWEELTGEQLDLIAVNLNLYNYNPVWEIEKKRGVLQKAIFEKSKLGTVSAVKKALSLLNNTTSIYDWFEQTPIAEPYTFVVLTKWDNMAEEDWDPQKIYQVKTFIDYAKPARCLYKWYIDGQAKYGAIALKGIVRAATSARISNYIQ